MKPIIISIIAFDVITLLAMFIIYYKRDKKESDPNVFLDKKESNCNLLDEIKSYKWNPKVELNKSFKEIKQLDPYVNLTKAICESVNTVNLVNRYNQAIKEENYELAGELNKQIESLKSESSAHNN